MSSQSKKESKKAAGARCNAEDCMRALMTTVKVIHRYGESKLSEYPEFRKLSGARIGVLFMVQEAGAIKMGDLASKLMVAPRSVTDLIDGMERDGFLRRVPHPSDRRAMLIELTPEIKANFHKISSVKKKFFDEMFSVLSEKEQEELIYLLDKLRQGPLSKLAQAIECSE